jgi:hypothetical protein
VTPKRFVFRLHSGSQAFHDHFSGYSGGMSESDEIPTADAVEQQREAGLPDPDEEASAELPGDVPLEASGADWQEQRQEIIDDPEERTND